MPPRPLAASAAGWRCAQCTIRSFSSSARQLAVGPEHPRYIPIPLPPQQDAPRKTPVKGVLPVPRDVFAGTDRSKTDDEFIALSTPQPRKLRIAAPGSREDWKAKMSEIRKQNLAEGVKSLRTRQQMETRRLRARSTVKQNEREQLLHRPEREDERLTAPSNNLDLDALFNKPIPDPTREQRLQKKMENLSRFQETKRRARMESMHALYMNARDFIVTPQQLDRAIDHAFGTPEAPKGFGSATGPEYGAFDTTVGKSIWAEGRPDRVQDMLNKATGQKTKNAVDVAGGVTDINKDRIRRIAETLTGGKMEHETR